MPELKTKGFGLTLILVAILSLLKGTESPAQDDPVSAEPAADSGWIQPRLHRWHLPRRNTPELSREAADPVTLDWNPVAAPMDSLKRSLNERGITFDLDLALFGEAASNVLSGKKSVTTFSWESAGDWEVLPEAGWGTGYLVWNAFGTVGLNYDPRREIADGAIGSLSIPNNTVYNDPAILDELHWKQVSPSGKLVVLAGKVDMLSYFDTSRVANDSFNQFYAGSLSNKLSLPAPLYGGLGGLVRAQISDDVYVMAAMGDSSSNDAVAPWKSLENHSWYQLFELGVNLELEELGKGQYGVIPWHNHFFGEDGWGIGFNFDQELGNEDLLAFFRFGTGDEAVTAVKRFLSAGLAYNAPFGRSSDTIAVGFSRANPSSGFGLRTETLIETYYRLALSSSLELTPNLQVLIDPALAPGSETVVIGGLRLTMRF